MLGISFETLLSEFKIKKDDVGNRAIDLDPEVLFSMYDDTQECQKFAHFVFPQKISVQVEKIMPKFHSFCSQDENSVQSFFHCFIFHEELSEYDLTDYKFTEHDLNKMREKNQYIKFLK